MADLYSNGIHYRKILMAVITYSGGSAPDSHRLPGP